MNSDDLEFVPETPLRVEFETLSACNKHCEFCYSAPFNNKIMPFDDVVNIMQKTKAQANPFDVVFLGGEPFLRKDMISILQMSFMIFDTTYVSTNGTQFWKMENKRFDILRELSSNGNFIQVSLDSTRDKNTQRNVDTFNGIKILEREEIPYSIGIVLNKQNQMSIETTFYDISTMNLVRGVNLQPLVDHPDEALTQLEMRSVKEIGLKILGKINIVGVENNTEHLKDLKRDGSELKDRRLSIGCVLVNGDVVMGGAYDRYRPLGNVKKDSWSDMWITAKDFIRKEQSLLKKQRHLKKVV